MNKLTDIWAAIPAIASKILARDDTGIVMIAVVFFLLGMLVGVEASR